MRRVHPIVVLALAVWLAVGWLAVLARFVVLHGRFPAGSGEALNWLFGL